MDTTKLSQKALDSIHKNKQTQLLEAPVNFQNTNDEKYYIEQLEHLDFDLSTLLYNLSLQKDTGTNKFSPDLITPIPEDCQFSKERIENLDKERLVKVGLEQIYQGKIGLLILCGGLGTRLGFGHAKALYPVGMPSGKPLINYLIDRFHSAQLLAKSQIKGDSNKDCTLFIMTSQQNNNEIVNLFEDNNYFHLKKENVIFFPQNEICYLDQQGRALKENINKVYQAPDGNGGCFLAMKQHKIVDECIKRGIDFINVCAIDNPLYKVLDPLYIGITVDQAKVGKSQMSAKYKKKTDPNQKIGNFALYNKKPTMIDYMELPDMFRTLKKENGEFAYNAGNILDYIISIEFLNSVLNNEKKMQELIHSFHVLRKKLDGFYYDEASKDYKEIKKGDALKFEIFFNSIFEFAEPSGLLLIECDHVDEFAPIKNAEGASECTVLHTRKAISNLFKKWYAENNGEILNDDPEKLLEISFLNCYDSKYLFSTKFVPEKLDLNTLKAGQGIYIKNEEIEK